MLFSFTKYFPTVQRVEIWISSNLLSQSQLWKSILLLRSYVNCFVGFDWIYSSISNECCNSNNCRGCQRGCHHFGMNSFGNFSIKFLQLFSKVGEVSMFLQSVSIVTKTWYFNGETIDISLCDLTKLIKSVLFTHFLAFKSVTNLQIWRVWSALYTFRSWGSAYYSSTLTWFLDRLENLLSDIVELVWHAFRLQCFTFMTSLPG